MPTQRVTEKGDGIKIQRLAQRLKILDGPVEAQLRWIADLGPAAAPGVEVHQLVVPCEGVERAHVLVTELGPADHDKRWSGPDDLHMDIDVTSMRDLNGALQ